MNDKLACGASALDLAHHDIAFVSAKVNGANGNPGALSLAELDGEDPGRI